MCKQATQGGDGVVRASTASIRSVLPRTAGVPTRLAYEHAADKGLPVGALLKRAGLTRQQIGDRAARLIVSKQMTFMNLVAQALRDDRLGLHLARHYELRQLGWYYYATASSGTLLEALQRGARCSALLNEGIVQTVIDGRDIGVRFRCAGVSRHRDRHQIEFWMTSLVRMCRAFTGVALLPIRLQMVHQQGRNVAEARRFFGCDIKFGAGVDELVFAGRLRHLPLVNADPYLNRLLIAYCGEAIVRQHKIDGSMSTRVQNAIIPLLPHGVARAGYVARRLGVSQRSLARHLAGEGLSFSRLLSELRLDLARHYLRDEELTVSHVAWLLGYHDVAAFSNAYKRWTGSAPSAAMHAVERRRQ